MDLEQQVTFLKKIYFFNDFDDHELKQFLSVSKWMVVSDKTLVIEENSIGKGFYVLVHGEVAVFKTNSEDGSTVLLTTLTDGDCFGEMSLVTETKRTAGIITTRNSFILMVNQEIINNSNVFLQLKFYKRFCEILVNRLIRANQRVVSQLTVPQQPVNIPSTKETKPGKIEIALTDRLLEGSAGSKQKTGVTPPPSNIPVEREPVVQQSAIESSSQPDQSERRDKLGALSIRRRLMPEQYLTISPGSNERLAGYLHGEINDTRGFAETIMLDPALSASVLQCANSSFFRRATVVATVPHAMITVGIKHIQELAGEVVDRSKNILPFGGTRGIARKFWEHAVVVGRIAEMLKDAIRISMPADIYLAGLLHDLGMLALDKFDPTFYVKVEQQDPEMTNIIPAEKEYIGADHCQTGFWLMEKMGLPQVYQDVSRFHHAPEGARDNYLAVALVHLADLFAEDRGACIGGQKDMNDSLQRSFAWVLIQEQSRAFMDVNIAEFIDSMKAEIDKTWKDLVREIP
ncbi:MAG: hypothetical protein A2511_02285 [Deltaproteobacteria bacterium RIFOXYD12_FULL_50_9]|nr:MAG: hypothetical protein A2511_02285 [Deltaproteobacteria bacterium RIFOXYD12_FULL_50_9]